MLASYRDLFTIPGSRGLVLASFVGRMSASMMALGIVLLVSAVSGSYGTAGAVAATYGLARAAAGPQVGRFTDSLGQSRVLPPQIAIHAGGGGALLSCAELGLPRWTLFASAAVAGASLPMAGTLARARWVHMLRGSPRLDTAFALESVLAEIVFMTGPVLVTALTTQVHQLAGLAFALGCKIAGTSALAVQRRTEPPASRKAGGRHPTAIRSGGIATLATTFFAAGTVLGSLELVVVAFCEAHGARSAAGLVLGVHAFGSLLTGMAYGSLAWRRPLHRRFSYGIAGFAAALVPLVFVPAVGWLFAAMFVSGLTLSPVLIPGFGLVGRLIPTDTVTEGFMWLATGVGVGMATGASIAGQVIDALGVEHAFLVPLAGGAAAAMITASRRRSLRPRA